MLKTNKIKISYNSPVILGYIFLCFGALLVSYLTRGYSNHLVFSTYRASLLDPFTYIRFIGHVFGHANWEHFIGNMTLLLVVGPMLEEKYGSSTMAMLIGITAVVTGIIHFVLFPHIQLLGASGVVFAMILFSSITSVKQGYIPLTFILVTVIYIGNQLYQAVAIRDNISNLSHIIGGIIGAFLGFLLNKKR